MNIQLPKKAQLVLQLIAIALVCIAIRVWYLAAIQYDAHFLKSRRPQRKTSVEYAARASIRDRFNNPLAINRIAYKAQLAYAPIRQIPSLGWRLDEKGQKVRAFPRKEYIKNLSSIVAQELSLDPARVEDLIHAKAALYSSVPYTIKENLTENEYYRLRLLEKDWPGLSAEKVAKRDYPHKRCAADLIGYMGAISQAEFEKRMGQRRQIAHCLSLQEEGEEVELPEGCSSWGHARQRLQELEELAYTQQDRVGKSGIEAQGELLLRGAQGKKSYYTDVKGNILQHLPGMRPARPGKRLLLTISQELQEFSEKLLVQNEQVREAKISTHGKATTSAKQPWIKGGAIVALDPYSGEVLALASYPRMDPNDFISKNRTAIDRWLESPAHLAALWNETTPLRRERYDKQKGFYDEERFITWDHYLLMLLSAEHPIVRWFSQQGSLRHIVDLLRGVEQIESTGIPLHTQLTHQIDLLKNRLPHSHLDTISSVYNQLLLIDLCRLAVFDEAFDEELLKEVGHRRIGQHKQEAVAFYAVQEALKPLTKELFHQIFFLPWRQENEKIFLKEKRQREKIEKSFAKPYIDYLDEEEQRLFDNFWKNHKQALVISSTLQELPSSWIAPFASRLIEESSSLSTTESFLTLKKALKPLSSHQRPRYLATLRSFQELNRPLKGSYNGLRGHCERDLASAFYPKYGFGYGRSFAYRQAAPQGSLFKLITAYEAMMQTNQDNISQGRPLKNPLDVVDHIFKQDGQTYVGRTSSGKPIPQMYKGGRIPRSHQMYTGPLDLTTALETSSNMYFALLAGDLLKDPEDLAHAARLFGFGTKTGIEIPGEIAGQIPKDLATNRTGLYATSIGQHTLVVTPLQSSLMLAAIANHGALLHPKIFHAIAGKGATRKSSWLDETTDDPALRILGLDFPLFGSHSHNLSSMIQTKDPIVRWHIPLPSSLSRLFIQAMHSVLLRTHSQNLWTLSRLYLNHPEAISDFIALKNEMVGKTSTAEARERLDLDEEQANNVYTHVWFGGICFDGPVEAINSKPELIIVVYLRFGGYGKESAPLAAQVARKWRAIKQGK